MKRKIIRIDEELCNGCGNCVPNCHEGALQIIDGKARLISDLMCDGLGACLGHCPEGAITVEEREAEEYNETEVMKGMIPNGKNTLIAHFTHLLDHEQDEYFKEGISYLFDRKDELAFDVQEVIEGIRNHVDSKSCGCSGHSKHPGGCPGSQEQSFEKNTKSTDLISSDSQLTHWPIQLHLINPSSAHFKNCDLLVAADCTAFSIGNFHPDYLKGRKLIIACPKLDDGQDSYLEKIRKLIAVAHVNTITVMRMEVPCCFSLVQMVKHAIDETGAKVPLKEIVVGTTGEIVSSNWI